MIRRARWVAVGAAVAALTLLVFVPLGDAVLRRTVGLNITPLSPKWHGDGCKRRVCGSPDGWFWAEPSSKPAVRPGERGHSAVWVRSKGDGIAWEGSYDLPETWRSRMHLQWGDDNRLWLYLSGDVDELWVWERAENERAPRYPGMHRKPLGKPNPSLVLPHPLCRKAGTRCAGS